MQRDSGLDAKAERLRLIGSAVLWFCPILIIAALWEVVTVTGLVNARLLPSLTSVLAAGAKLWMSGEVPPHLLTSLYRALVGLLLGSSTGVSIGILMVRSQRVRELVEPFVTLTFTLPKTAFIPIALLWLGVGDASTILVVFLGTLVPMIISAYHGAGSVHNHLIWSAQAMGASRWRVLTSVILPASLAYIVNGIRIALAFSIVVVISAEMVAADRGIGKFVSVFGENGNYDYMFSTILTIVAVAFVIDRAFLSVSRRLLRWADFGGAP